MCCCYLCVALTPYGEYWDFSNECSGCHHTCTAHCNGELFNLVGSLNECVRIKEAKTKAFMDGLGHRGSERPTEREMRLFMSIHDQCGQAMFGVFSLDQ